MTQIPKLSGKLYNTFKTVKYFISHTLPPGKDFIFQTRASFSGTYAADPIEVLTLGFVASESTGSSISTFVAVLH